ncbi:hypothetical protein NP233_g6611 [Leucocoprinus birnbaumii]|uniref:Uncharacterized protein n=1 Tax=Leucocoprinus birnbaumii TaxID=56174 RepID=A0AAD5VQW1_9AGAR|nr:hypothetical protein NP233_g6611 [Leucocoprinus birnbaumii]
MSVTSNQNHSRNSSFSSSILVYPTSSPEPLSAPYAHSRESSFSSSILVYPTSSPEPEITPQITMDPSGKSACVVCYLEENKDPKIFYINQNDGWLSFSDDEEFIRASCFPETKFDIFHNQISEFMELGPDSVEWRFPSEKYSFFLLKKQSLSEDQCPKVDNWCLLLMEDLDDYIKLRASSPLPPSSPPLEIGARKY